MAGGVSQVFGPAEITMGALFVPEEVMRNVSFQVEPQAR
jgi:hypothetical protein